MVIKINIDKSDLNVNKKDRDIKLGDVLLEMRTVTNRIIDAMIMINDEISRQDTTIKDLETAASAKDRDIEEIKTEISDIKGTINGVKMENENLRTQNVQLENRIIELERYTRGFNLRFNGIEETTMSSEKENCIDILNNVFGELKLNNIKVENAHRVGKINTDGRPRSIIARFHSRPDLRLVLKERRKFFNMHIPVYQDLCTADLEAKKVYMEDIKKLYVSGKTNIYFNRGQWFVDGVKFNGLKKK